MVLILSVDETAHEFHVGQFMDAVSISTVSALEVRHIMVVLGRPRQHPIAVFRPVLAFHIFSEVGVIDGGEGERRGDGEAAVGIFISIGGNSFYNVATKGE